MGLLAQWIEVRDWLNPAIEYCAGTHTEETVFLGLMAKQYKLWKFERSAVVTEFHSFPTGIKVMHFFLMGGDKKEFEDKMPLMFEFAKANGCNRVSIFGRDGWKRELAPMGWEHCYTAIYKDI